MSALGNQSNLLIKLLTDHYYDVQWSKKHQGFRCVCGWLGESHVQHVADVLTEAGFTPPAEPENLAQTKIDCLIDLLTKRTADG